MNRSFTTRLYRFAFLLSFATLAFASSVFGQATLTAGTAASPNPTHQNTLSQQEIDVIFNQAVAPGATPLLGWIVTVNGTPVPVTSVTNFGPTLLRIKFDASIVNGAGKPFLLPGQTLNLQYTVGSATSASGLGIAPFSKASVNNWIFTCNDLAFAAQGEYGTLNQCAPVNMNFHQFTFRISLRMRNSLVNAPTSVTGAGTVFNDLFMGVTWGDGTAVQSLRPYLSDGTLNPVNANAAFYEATAFPGGNPDVMVTLRPTHIYPTANPTDCSFNFSLTPFWNGVTTCNSASQSNLFATYDTDDKNSGALNLPASVVNTDRVCLGSNANMQFSDATLLNCRVGVEPTIPNDQGRYIRFVYGSQVYAAPGNIPDVHVKAPAAFGGSTVLVTSDNALATISPAGGFFFTGAGGAGQPDFNGAVLMPQPVTVGSATAYMARITTTDPQFQVLGQRFYVRMDYWDVCNPYNAADPTNPAPVSITNYIEIVSKPAPLTTAGQIVCYSPTNGGIPTNFTVASTFAAAARTSINWYKDVASYNAKTVLAPPGNSLTFPVISYPGAGTPVRTDNANGAYYSIYATQIISAGLCESDPVEVVLIQQPKLTAPATTITGATDVCNGGAAVTYTETTAITSKNIGPGVFSNPATIPLTSQYLWSSSFGAGVTISPVSGIGNSTAVTYAIPTPPVVTTSTINVLQQYQTAVADQIQIKPLSPQFTTSPNNTVGIYKITPLACPTANTNVTVNVYAPTVGGTVSPTPLKLCDGAGTGVLKLTGQVGTILRWERSLGAAITNMGNAGSVNLPSDIPPGPGVYNYYAVIQNTGLSGPCAVVNSAPAVVTVSPQPTGAVLSGGGSVCKGTASSINVVVTGGTGPFTVTLTDGTIITPYNSGDPIPVTPTTTTTYGLTSVKDAAGCFAPPSGAPVVTISNPTDATFSGGTSICSGSANLKVVINGGTGPYTIKYNDGTTTFTIPGYASGATIAVSPTATTTYTLTSVKDANLCDALALLGNPQTVVVGVLPTSAVFSGSNTVCVGDPLNLKLVITGGVAPFTITLDHGYGSITTYASGDPIPIPTTAPTGGAVSYNVTVVTDACLKSIPPGGITGNPQNITVNPKPIGGPSAPAVVCSQTNLNINPASNISNGVTSTFAWTATYTGGMTGPASGSGNIAGVVVNKTSVQQTATFTVVPTSTLAPSLCAGASFVITQKVDPEPVGTNQTVAAQCSNSAFSVDPFITSVKTGTGGNNVTSTYAWVGSYPAGLTVVTAGTGTGNIAEKIQNLSGGQITATYTVTPTSGTCGGTPFTIKVPINPEPVGASPTTTTVCSNVAFSFDPQVVAVNVAGGNSVVSTFAWTAAFDPGLTGGTASGTGNITGNITNATAGSLNAKFTITPKATTGSCVGTPFVITVPIGARASIGAQPTPVISCLGDNISYTITATGPGLTYQWQENGTNITDGLVGVVTYGGSATTTLTINNVTAAMSGRNYKVVLTTTGSCTVTSNAVLLTVNPLPAVTNQTPSACSDLPGGTQATVNLTSNNAAINSGAVTITYYLTYTAATKTFSSPIAPGTALGQDQKFTLSNGDVIFAKVVNNTTLCVNVATVTYTVKPMPLDNVIRDGTGVELAKVSNSPLRYDQCKSSSSILFQTDATINPGSSFTWPVQPTSYAGEFKYVTNSANIIVMQFPNYTEGNPASTLYQTTGIPVIVRETLNGCVGNPVEILVHVLNNPAQSVIVGPSSVCDGGTASYSVVNVAGTTYSWTLPPGAVITSTPVNKNAIDVQMSSFGGSVGVTSFSGLCPSPAAVPISVAVSPRPVATVTNSPICSGSVVSSGVTLSSNIAGSTFNWEVLSIAGNITGSNVGDVASNVLAINQTPINVSGIAASITYRVIPVGPGPDNCAGGAQTFSVVINPEPVLNLTPKVLCSKDPAAYEIKLNPPNLPSNSQFRWAAPVMSDGSSQGAGTGGVFIPMGGAGTLHINTAFNNKTSSQITATYVIEAQAGTCVSGQSTAARTVVLTINPEPVGTNQSVAAVCSNTAFIFDPQVISINAAGGNNVPSTFTWTATYDPGVTGGLPSGTGNITGTLVNSTAGILNAFYTVTPKSTSASCAGSTFIVTVPISPQPVATSKTVAAVCSTIAFSFDPQALAVNGAGGNSVPSTFTWSAAYDPALSGGTPTGSGNVAGNLTNVSGSVANAVFTVTPKATAGGCLGNPFTITVPINSQPVATNKTTAAVCSAVVFTFDPQSIGVNGAGGNGVPSTFTWTAVFDAGLTGGTASGTGNVTSTVTNLTAGPLNAVFTVTPKSSSGGCIGNTFTITVPINPQPVATAKTAPAVCSTDAISIDPQVIGLNGAGGNHVASTFTWTATYQTGLTGGVASGSGNVTGVLTNLKSTVLNAVYTITPTATTGGCVGATFTITVPVNPQPVATAKTVAAVCSRSAIAVNLQTVAINGTGGNSVASTFVWTASYDAGLTGGTGGNSGNIAETLTNLTSGQLKAIYTVTPTSTAGLCDGNPFTVTVPVNPEPVATAKTMAAVCSKSAFSFDPQTVAVSAAGGNNVTSTFAWTAAYDPGLTGGVASGTGNLTGTLTNLTGGTLNVVFKVTPKASTGGCAGTPFNITVPVNPQPVATNKTTAGVCSVTAYSFDPQTVGINGAGGNTVPSTFTWIAAYDPGLSGGAGSGTGNVAGTITNITGGALNVIYTVTPTANTGGCVGNTFTITVPINPSPFGTDKITAAVCSNTAFAFDPQALSISAAGGNNVTSTFTWTALYDPGLTGGLANGTGNVSGSLGNITSSILNAVYTVTPKSSAGGCVGPTFKVTVPINPQPNATPKTTAAVCSNTLFSFDPQAVSVNGTGGNTVPSTFTWTAAYDAGLTGGATSGSNNVTGTLINLTNGTLNAIFTVTGKSQTGSCAGVPFTITVPISPQPVGTNKTTAAVCPSIPFSFDPQTLSINAAGGNSVNSTFAWTAVYDPGLTGGAPSGAGNVSGTLGNVSTGILNAVFTVTPTSTAGACPGSPPFKITVPVNPAPVGSTPALIERCSGDVTNVNFNSLITNGVASVYKYTLTADFAASLSPVLNPGTYDRTTKSNANSPEVFRNYSTQTVTLTYTVTPFSTPNDCAGAPFTVKLVYYPEPQGSNVNEPNCNSSLSHDIQTQITNALPSIFTYTVSSSDEAAVPTPAALDRTVASDALITDSYVNLSGTPVIVTYTITAFNKAHPTCAGATNFTYSVTISPKPIGVPAPIAAVCSDATFTINPQDYINPSVTSTFTWTATYDGNPIASGTGIITNAFNNKTNTVKNAVYTITPTSSVSHCVGDPFVLTQPINGEPVIDPGLAVPVPICSTNANGPNPTNIVLNTTSTSVAAASYNVKLRSKDPLLVGTPTVGTGLTANAIKNDTYRNTSSAQLKVIYAIVPIAGTNCVGDTVNVTVLVNPEPVVDPATANPAAVCSQDKTGIVFTTAGSSVAAASYTLISVTVPVGLTVGGSNAVANTGDDTRTSDVVKNDTYTNQTAGPLTVDYVIMPKSGQGCYGEPFTIHQAINAEPLIAATPPSVCSGVATGLVITKAVGTTNIASFEYISVQVPTGITADGANVLPGTYTSGNFLATDKFIYSGTGTAPKFVTYFIKPTSVTGSCASKATQQVMVQILPSPGVADGLDAILCSTADAYGKNLNYASTGPAALSYKIVPVMDPALTPVVFNPATRTVNNVNEIAGDMFTNPTNNPLKVTYNVTPYTATNGGGCEGAVKIITVTIEPTITAVVPTPSAVCSSDGVATNTNITLSSLSVPTAGPITFNYKAVSSIGTAQMTGFQPSADNLGQGYVIQDRLINNSNTSATVTYTITPIANGAKGGAACSAPPAVTPVSVVITVDPKPKVVATPKVQTVCYNIPTSIVLTSPTVPSAGTVQFTVASVVPDAGLTLTSPAVPKTVYAIGESITDSWKNDAPDQLTHSVVYTLVPSINGGPGCVGDAVVVTINVNPLPIVTATGNPGAVCSGTEYTLDLASTVDGTINRWVTSSVPAGIITGAGNGSGDQIVQAPRNTGTVPAILTYTVTPKANNCIGPDLKIDITINPTPIMTAIPKSANVCFNNAFTQVLTSDVAGTIFSWAVDPPGPPDVTSISNADATGTGNTINQIMKNTSDGQEILTYTITPTGPGNCPGKDATVTVHTSPEIKAQILNTETWICAGQKDFVQFQFDGQGPFKFKYSVNGVEQPEITNAANNKSIAIQPTTTTTYALVSLTDGLGCVYGGALPTWILNVSNFTAGFTFSPADTPASPILVGGHSSITFTNTTSTMPPNDPNILYEWDFGEDATPGTLTGPDATIVVDYTSQGQKIVSLQISNTASEAAGVTCRKQITETFVIKVAPLIAEYTAVPDAGCVPKDLTITSNTSTGDVMEWMLYRDGSLYQQSEADLPLFHITSPGQYILAFTTSDSKSGQFAIAAEKTFNFYGTPTADFAIQPDTIIFVPDTEIFTHNRSRNATRYRWDFDDLGNYSTRADTTYTYKVEGKYFITLVAYADHPDGVTCSDTTKVRIIAKPGGTSQIPNAFSPDPSGPSGGSSRHGRFYDVFLPNIKGVNQYNLQIYDRWGNLLFESNDSAIGWDGYKDGHMLPAGVYVYKITLQLNDGQRTTQLGDVTLIR